MTILRSAVKFFLAFVLAFSANAQTFNNTATGPDVQNSQTGTMSNLLGNNIGTQQNTITETNTATTPSSTTAKIISVPTVYAPGLTAGGSDVCLGSASASLSVLGLGLSGGKTHVDENCVLLKNSQRLAALGFGNAALAMMMENGAVNSSVRLVSPVAYHRVAKDRHDELAAELAIAKRLGEDTKVLAAKLKVAHRELLIMEERLKTYSPVEVDKTVKIPEVISPEPSSNNPDTRMILK